ncbi:hypothetical protein Hamer_G013239 [Homarus americanus]|uniref:Uncharacterized protein n=1 Tax=Homarus americanus TaxID=6706 RepID=A0A8J5K9J2_HOMAM|nr:hypothetical protein Hamer_G013239 [Homarus americanus]
MRTINTICACVEYYAVCRVGLANATPYAATIIEAVSQTWHGQRRVRAGHPGPLFGALVHEWQWITLTKTLE